MIHQISSCCGCRYYPLELDMACLLPRFWHPTQEIQNLHTTACRTLLLLLLLQMPGDPFHKPYEDDLWQLIHSVFALMIWQKFGERRLGGGCGLWTAQGTICKLVLIKMLAKNCCSCLLETLQCLGGR